jgi:hypothetical protein
MPTTYTDLLRLAKQATGENDNTWGDIFNANTLEMLEDAIAKVESISVTAGNVTLTTNNGTADQSRAAVLQFTGTPATTRTVTIPSVNKVYIAHNKTSDSSSVVITSGGTGDITLVSNSAVLFFCDGANIISLTSLDPSKNLSDLTNASTARTNLGLGTMATQAANSVNITGGAISGISPALAVASGGTGSATAAGARTNLDVYSKSEVDGKVAVVQSLYFENATLATTTSRILNDNTIPQITEGLQFISGSITPTSATNKLRITVNCTPSKDSNAYNIVAIFKNSDANAIRATSYWQSTGTAPQVVTLTTEVVAGTTSPITFSGRVGSASTGTLTINGQAGAAKLGGVMACTMTIEEITV